MSRRKPLSDNSREGVTPGVPPTPWWRLLLREPVALCLAVPILLRPWMDGITYPTDNFYFLWFLAAVFAVWSIRQMLSGTPMRCGVPVLLLAAFFVVAVLTGLNTIQVYATYRSILMWAGYFFLFVLATNGIRSRLGADIVLGACVTVFLAESVWSLLHLRYVLPYVRQMILNDPRLLVEYFGATEVTPELAHRLNSNRAFGSLLFPNALAAFLTLGIPCAAVGSVYSSRAWLRAIRTQNAAATGSPARRFYSLVIGMTALVITVCAAFFVFTFFAFFAYPKESWTQHPVPFALYVIAVPVAVSAASAIVTRACGPLRFGLALRAVTFLLLAPLEVVCLWLTYSRGAMLGMAAACAWVGLLWFLVLLRGRLAKGAAGTAAAVMLLAVSLLAAATISSAWAEQPSPAPPAAEAAGHPPDAKLGAIQVGGRWLTMRDLANPSSLELRFSYWRTGLDMAKAHFWTGVGLGNFRTAFPGYQQPGAADVKMAHNDYLQTLCETGVFGFCLFAAFWAYFVVWGARQILREPDGLRRWTLTGVYGGVVAFLVHSALDFNFYNPSLAFYAYLLAGVFYVQSSSQASSTEKRAAYQAVAVPLLVAAALVSGMAVRTYLPDYVLGEGRLLNVGDEKVRNAKFRTAGFFLRDVRPDRSPQKPAIETWQAVSQLIPVRSQVESFGQIWAPATEKGGKNRRLSAGEDIPAGAFVAITNPGLAREVALAAIKRWIATVEVADSIFPYSPEVAAHLVNWYDLLLQTAGDDEQKKREYTLAYAKWTTAGIERSPLESWYHEWYAKGLWLRANLESGTEKMNLLRKGLDEFRRATELYPSSPLSFSGYADALTKFGNYLKTPGVGRETEGAEYITAAQGMFDRAEQLAEKKRHGLTP